MHRTLYFDIDGVLNSHNDEPKDALLYGNLERVLKALDFRSLFCLSGWSDAILNTRLAADAQRMWIYQKVEPLFPDRQWFLNSLFLTNDSAHRCKHIDMKADWYYIDDLADVYFVGQFGKKAYQREIGKRILMANAYGDGRDILEWLGRIKSPARSKSAS